MRLPLLIVGCLWLFASVVNAQVADPATTQPKTMELSLAEGVTIDFEELQQTDDGWLLIGAVKIQNGATRIQADRVIYREQRYIEAEGNVLLIWEGSRIFGQRLEYDLKKERGRMEQASGHAQDKFLFWAKVAEKIGNDTVKLKGATFTTCTQPTPYWSFNVTSATIKLGGYARMWNPRLTATKLPVFYMPYIIWPVKDRRAAGLLMPQFHTTARLGSAISQELFVPLGDSADVTFLTTYYEKAGFGAGGELRFLPSRRGSASLRGFYIDDEVVGEPRWNVEYKQEQQFDNGFRMVADISQISDFNYYSDFVRELNLVSSPSVLARVEFSRNGAWSSLNVRDLRREQLRSDGSELVQQTLPELEWRGRSRKLGKSPLYFSFQSSLASIQQREKPTACTVAPCSATQLAPLDADYGRVDLFPTFSMPLSPTPWLDVTPSVSYRMTHWTQRYEPLTLGTGDITRVAASDAISRNLFGANLSIVGPKIYRIFDRKDGARFKHSIEPRIAYGYLESFDRTDELILYDDVDTFNGSGANLSYSLVQRLFAKRPRATPDQGDQPVMLADGSLDDPLTSGVSPVDPTQPFADLPEKDAPSEPIEIATFEFRQARSFNRDLSFADLDGDGVDEENSPYGNLQMIGRYNPSRTTSIDLRGNYHILYDDFSDVTLSGQLRTRRARTGFSVIHRNGLGVINTGSSSAPIFTPREDDTQVRLDNGLNLFQGRLQLNLSTTFTAKPPQGQSRFPDKRFRIAYATQCCTFMVERFDRSFLGLEDRRDYTFRIDLTGIGRLFDFSY